MYLLKSHAQNDKSQNAQKAMLSKHTWLVNEIKSNQACSLCVLGWTRTQFRVLLLSFGSTLSLCLASSFLELLHAISPQICPSTSAPCATFDREFSCSFNHCLLFRISRLDHEEFTTALEFALTLYFMSTSPLVKETFSHILHY